MKTVYSKLIPTEEYGEFLLSFTCQKCSENNAVVLKITNEEGFEYLQQRCEKCGELHRVYVCYQRLTQRNYISCLRSL